MAKVQLKSDNINPFGGIYPVSDDIFASLLANCRFGGWYKKSIVAE